MMAAAEGKVYEGGAYLVGLVTFFLSWGYCVVEYGFLLGLGLGWLPAAILAVVAGLLWPALAAILAVGAVALLLLLLN